jgi:FMN phosphatase YigB (HAD superfamily)
VRFGLHFEPHSSAFHHLLKTSQRKNMTSDTKSALMTSAKILVASDLDETMTPFIGYWSPAMRHIIPKLAKVLSKRLKRPVTKDEISFELGRVMAERGTHEWWCIWELSKFWQCPEHRKVWKNFDEFKAKIIRPYDEAVDVSREKNCKPYPNVIEALRSLKEHGKKVVIVSNGPDYSVFRKVALSGLDKYIDLVIAIDMGEPPAEANLTEEDLAYGRARVAAGKLVPLACSRMSIPAEWMKPDPRGLELAMQWVKAKPEETVMVGDSLPNDGGAAKNANVPFLWASYGTLQPEEYRKTIEEHFVHPDKRVKRVRKQPPMLTKWGAATWAEILDHLGPEPMPLKPTILNDSQHATASEGPGH